MVAVDGLEIQDAKLDHTDYVNERSHASRIIVDTRETTDIRRHGWIEWTELRSTEAVPDFACRS